MLDWPWRLDSWIIDGLCQPVCDRLAGWTTCYRIAAFLFTGAIAMSLLVMGATLVRSLPAPVQAVECLLVSVLTFFWMLWLRRSRRLDETATENVVPIARISDFPGRIAYLAWGCVMTLDFVMDGQRVRDILFTAGWFLATAGLYFMACRKNPPKRREARAPWLMRWRAA